MTETDVAQDVEYPTNPDPTPDGAQTLLESTPTIDDVPETNVELPGGIFIQTGLTRAAEVRELNGEDEEALARNNPRKNVGKFITTLLHRGVVSIGGNPVDDSILRSLSIGDRDFLVLQIRRVTYGDDYSVNGICPDCGFKNEFSLNLGEDVPVTILEDEEREWVVTISGGVEVHYRIPSGGDQERIFSTGKKTLPEINSEFLASCILQIGKTKAPDITNVRQLSSRDRRTILKEMFAKVPGPKYQDITGPCASCGQDFTLPVDVTTDFFLS